jgi:hypothetical protein
VVKRPNKHGKLFWARWHGALRLLNPKPMMLHGANESVRARGLGSGGRTPDPEVVTNQSVVAALQWLWQLVSGGLIVARFVRRVE